jgi:hypothetical protein
MTIYNQQDDDLQISEENIAFVLKHYRDAIKQDTQGFYYENADTPPARFYFDSLEEAAEDLAIEIGVTDTERRPFSHKQF